MEEADFWPRLEHRLCHEFAGMPVEDQRRFWCDGFIPREYRVTGRRPRIVGKAWICIGNMQFEWDFTLHPRQIKSGQTNKIGTGLLCRKRWLAFVR